MVSETSSNLLFASTIKCWLRILITPRHILQLDILKDHTDTVTLEKRLIPQQKSYNGANKIGI